MSKIKTLLVKYNGREVGRLALYKERLAAFEYNAEWIADGFSISPFSLPLEKRVFIPEPDPFEGLYGVFSDSLPDGWGRLLVDRMLLKNHIEINTTSSLERLAIVGSSGMGALTYEPEYILDGKEKSDADLDSIAVECSKILNNSYSKDLDGIFLLGGSSGGARPKILTRVDGEEWIIKFHSKEDARDIGEKEYLYSLCAKKCGIRMEETRLFPSSLCSGYFGTRRFDRGAGPSGGTERIHMLSVSSILETSHRIPNLDYHILLRLTLELTKDFNEVEEMYRLMCFNVFAHNRDDHAKNFSFLFSEGEGWRLSPAYDLTYSSSIGGEHATCVNGNGRDPGIEDILAVARQIGLKENKAKEIAYNIKDIVGRELE